MTSSPSECQPDLRRRANSSAFAILRHAAASSSSLLPPPPPAPHHAGRQPVTLSGLVNLYTRGGGRLARAHHIARETYS